MVPTWIQYKKHYYKSDYHLIYNILIIDLKSCSPVQTCDIKTSLLKGCRMLNIQKYNIDLQCINNAQTSHIPWACSEKGIKFHFCILSGQESQHPSVGITRELKPQHTLLHRCSTSTTLIDLKTQRVLCASVNPQHEVTESQRATENPSHAHRRSAKPCISLHWKNMIPTAIIHGNKLEQARSPAHWVCWEHQLHPNAQRGGILSIFLKSSSWLVGTVKKLHLDIYFFFIYK